MSSNTPYGTGPFERNQRLTARHLETLRDATAGNVQIRNPDNFVKRLPGGHILTSKRRNKSGGAQRPYVVITAVTDRNTYVGDVRTPTDATVLVEDVAIKALDPTAGGSLKIGDKFFSDLTDGVYYIEPSVLRGS